MSKKQITFIFFFCAVLVILAAYMFAKHSVEPKSQISESVTSEPAMIEGWTTCDYPGYGFKLQYPPDWGLYVTSNSQGGGERGAFLVKCGDIEAGRILGTLVFRPLHENGKDINATLVIDPTRESSASHDAVAARETFLSSRGSVIFGGNKYTLSFGKDTSTTTENQILNSFSFVQ